jgi:hypothetical protein
VTSPNITHFDRATAWSKRIAAPIGSNRALDIMMASGFVAFIGLIFALAVQDPQLSYDLVPYIGAALHHFDLGSPMEAWNMLRQAAPDDVYRELASADQYRTIQSSDVTAFTSILPLYSAKIGYIYLLGYLAPWLGWIKSALWTSHVAGLMLGVICAFWMVREKCIQGAPLVAAVLLTTNYFDATRYPSPDIIAAVATLAAVYLWLKSRETTAMGLLLIAFLFRPDTLIFVFALLLSSAAFGLPKWRSTILFVMLLGLSTLIRNTTDHPGWWVHYYFSNVRIQNTMAGFDPAFTLPDWLKGQARGVFDSLTRFNWPVMLVFITAALLTMKQVGCRFSKRESAMLLACILTVGGKFLVFPLPDDRLYMTFILSATLVLLQVMQPRLAWR